MDNEERSYYDAHEQARHAFDNTKATEISTKKEMAAYDLADILKENYEEANPLADKATMWNDLLTAALSEVNWLEIAGSLLDDIEADD